MSLRKKTLLIIAAILICLVLILYTVSKIILLGSFARLEEEGVHRDVERALDALHDEISDINVTVTDWAAWDDTCAFIQDGNSNYIKSNLPDSTFSELKLNLILFIRNSGRVVYGRGFDLKAGRETPVPRSIREQLSAGSLLLRHPDPDSGLAGIVLLPEGPMLIASQPIVTSENKGPVRGTLIMGRYLDQTEISHLALPSLIPIWWQNLCKFWKMEPVT